MKKTILQHCTIEQQVLFDISKPINQAYATRMGFDYIFNSTRRCPDRSIYWEKIAYLREVLPTLEEGSLVVWEDADSINVQDESFEKALPSNGVFGMVQMRHGIDCLQLMDWYNAGVLIMKNTDFVREFLDRVWEREDPTDESAIMSELKHRDWVVGDGIYISSMNPKWNCWTNNQHLTPNPVVKSWHGIKLEGKLPAMQKFIIETKLAK